MPQDVSGERSGDPGAPGWSPDERDLLILDSLAQGDTVEAIARRGGVSERTVRRRLRAIADEIGVDSTIEAVVYAVRSRLI